MLKLDIMGGGPSLGHTSAQYRQTGFGGLCLVAGKRFYFNVYTNTAMRKRAEALA